MASKPLVSNLCVFDNLYATFKTKVKLLRNKKKQLMQNSKLIFTGHSFTYTVVMTFSLNVTNLDLK